MRTIILLFILSFGITIAAQNALHFDGIDDRVDCGNNASLQISNQLTLEAWIYANSWEISVFEGCIINKEQNVPDYGYMIRAGQGGRLGFNLGNGSWHELITAPLLTLNTWHHVAATYDGSKMRVYVDGLQLDSLNLSISLGNAANNLIIGDWYSSGRNFDGKIDEVRIWNVARSGAQIQANMNTKLCSLPPGLVAYYTFDQGTAGGSNSGVTTLYDQSGSGNNGSLGNFSLAGTTSNWVNGQTLPGGSSSGNLTEFACETYTSPSGNYVWNTTGIYTDTIPNVAGCDSILTIDLTIVEVDISLGMTGATLFAMAVNAYFQWVDCDNNYALIPGATSSSFTPTTNGNYTCIITQYGCTDTSICVPVTTVGVAEENTGEFTLSPNPAPSGKIKVEHSFEWLDLRVYDISGRLVMQARRIDKPTAQLVIHEPGVYFIKLVSPLGFYTKKMLVLH